MVGPEDAWKTSVINKLESGGTRQHSNPFQYFSMFLSHSKRILHRSTKCASLKGD